MTSLFDLAFHSAPVRSKYIVKPKTEWPQFWGQKKSRNFQSPSSTFSRSVQG